MTREEAEKNLLAWYLAWRSDEGDARKQRAEVTRAALTLGRILSEEQDAKVTA